MEEDFIVSSKTWSEEDGRVLVVLFSADEERRLELTMSTSEAAGIELGQTYRVVMRS